VGCELNWGCTNALVSKKEGTNKNKTSIDDKTTWESSEEKIVSV